MILRTISASRFFAAMFAVAALHGFALPALAATVPTTIHSFAAGDGRNPFGTPAFNASGTLYGTTQGGGKRHFGTIYKLDPATGTESVLYSFTAHADGAFPQAGLVIDAAGALYGTSISVATHGAGAVFRFDPVARKFSVLHAFRGGTDGFFPEAPLVFDKASILYGTTLNGGGAGNLSNCPPFCGTVFRLNPATGAETVLHAFTGGPDGGDPLAGLTFGPDGLLYGTAFDGGANCGVAGCGVVFRIDP
jgi:uncharacterized repeat protein (TIGR03803 family)